MPLPAPGVSATGARPRTLTVARLLERSEPGTWAELQFRADQVMLCLLLPLLAVLLYPVLPDRRLRHGSLAIGIGGYFVYRNLLEAGRSMMAREQIPAALGTWWVHLLLVCVLALLLYRRTCALPGQRTGWRRP